MKILFGNQEYLDIKLAPKEDRLIVTVKTKWEENSYAMSSAYLTDEQVDKLISELITLKPKIKKNVEV